MAQVDSYGSRISLSDIVILVILERTSVMDQTQERRSESKELKFHNVIILKDKRHLGYGSFGVVHKARCDGTLCAAIDKGRERDWKRK